MRQLRKFISQRISVSSNQLDELVACFNVTSLKRGEQLLAPGTEAQAYYFISKGCLRIFYKKEDEDITAWIAAEHTFFCELSQLIPQKKGIFAIEALEDARVCSISEAGMQELYGQFAPWQEFGRKVWQEAFSALVTRVVLQQLDSPEEQYHQLLSKNNIHRRAPLHHLASFLGVSTDSVDGIARGVGHCINPGE